MKEIWKPVPIKQFKNSYMVSNKGNVKSVDRHVMHINGRNNFYKGKPKKLSQNSDGYLIVILSYKRFRKTCKVGRLVAKAFIENPENKPQTNHLDGIKTNNVVSNLEWCTQSENEQHAYRTGLKVKRYGEEVGGVKLNNQKVKLARCLHEVFSWSLAKICKYFSSIWDITKPTICLILNYKAWPHI